MKGFLFLDGIVHFCRHFYLFTVKILQKYSKICLHCLNYAYFTLKPDLT